jgi:hypothetical protein
MQAGVAVSKWAIEYEQPAADAFKLNNPDAAVFCNNCNAILVVSTGVLLQPENSTRWVAGGRGHEMLHCLLQRMTVPGGYHAAAAGRDDQVVWCVALC